MDKKIMENVHAVQRVKNHKNGRSTAGKNRQSARGADGDQDSSHGIESFHILDKILPTRFDSTDQKISWLRSQIIGGTAVFDTPFGRRRLTYADHTASGRSLQFVEDCIASNLLPFYGNTHTSDSYVGQHTTEMMHEATHYVKKCLGGGEDDAIMFCGSGTTAAIKRLQEVMGIAVPSVLRERVVLNCLSKEERWTVFVGPYEHHSNILSWRQSLAEVVEIGLDGRTGSIDMEDLRQKLELYQSQKRPILGSFSACSNVTGICSDTRGIARLLHRFGGFACFDFAASAPHVEIDMRSGDDDGYDAVYISTHKFLGGPGSPGILLMNKALYRIGSAPPSTCGGGTVNYVNDWSEKDTLYVENIEEREDAGTPPIIQKIRAALAFSVKEWIGHKHIKRLEEVYIQTATRRLLPNANICILGNTTSKRQAILSFLIHSTTLASLSEGKLLHQGEKIGQDFWAETRGKPLNGAFTAKLLNDLFGIQARGGCACAGPYGNRLLNIGETHSLALRSIIEKGYAGTKPGWTRVSFPYYMSNEEFEFVLAAIEFLAIYGQRFLPLYHFSWRTGAWIFKKKGAVFREKTNSPVSSGTLASMMKSLNLFINKKKSVNLKANDNQINQENMVCRYSYYLETAKHIASLLSKFPPQRKIPEDIDIDLVPFRV